MLIFSSNNRLLTLVWAPSQTDGFYADGNKQPCVRIISRAAVLTPDSIAQIYWPNLCFFKCISNNKNKYAPFSFFSWLEFYAIFFRHRWGSYHWHPSPPYYCPEAAHQSGLQTNSGEGERLAHRSQTRTKMCLFSINKVNINDAQTTRRVWAAALMEAVDGSSGCSALTPLYTLTVFTFGGLRW